MSDPLAPWFLGAYGENNDFFEHTLLELVRDHVFWRRNFHPEDPPSISPQAQYEPAYLEGLARTRRELHLLTAQLKRSVPFFHPRYQGHMVSELLMPGLIAQLVTTLYNPNNVAEEAAPVTVQLELEVGQQLCRMVGFGVDPKGSPCALGHLTSGGTLANDEALWLARATRLFPLAAKDACVRLDAWRLPELEGADDFELLNLPTAAVHALAARVQQDEELAREVLAARVETVGLGRFAARHPLVAELAVLAPATAHYSWPKALKLLGLGSEQLELIPTREARMDPSALLEILERRARHRQPVLMAVGVYGTTEFGTLDPLHELVALRGAPLGFWLHVDAAWGGYIPSLFRDATGALRPHGELRAEFKHFPSERVYRTTAALAEADSVTVDPHKLGFVPFGAGALLVRDRRAFDLVHQEAAYVFVGKDEDAEARYRKPGRFALEGSKPGAAAAACAINHRVLPLDAAHFGRLIARSVHATETLFDFVPTLAKKVAPVARLSVPFEPDCNLLCLAVSPNKDRSLRSTNAFGRRLYEAMAVRADTPVQLRRFFGSCTTVPLSHFGKDDLARVGQELELDLLHADDDSLFLLRHTLMNPWLLSPAQGAENYVLAYAEYLAELIASAARST